MQTFLNQFAKYYLHQFKKSSQRPKIVLPSKRAVFALKNTFAKQNTTFWLPETIDIVEYIKRLSGLKIIDNQESLLKLYDFVGQSKENKESFESFYSWGSMLISDFNEIDRFLVDTDHFFEHHKALKELYFFGENKTELIKSYINFWERMPGLYKGFKESLLDREEAYQGLAYRIACENIHKQAPEKDVIFLGFNALNKAEEKIFETLLKQSKAKIVWDIEEDYLKERQHPSNNFIKKYISKWENYKKHFIFFKNKPEEKKSITVIPSPKNIGQSKAVAEILARLSQEEINKTAIVLNDENLINPILNSIPSSVKEVNITMGMPLQKTSHSSFFENILDFQKKGNNQLKFDFVCTCLDSEVLDVISQNEKDALLSIFEKEKTNMIDLHLLKLNNPSDVMVKFLRCLHITKDSSLFLKHLLEFINSIFKIKKESPVLEGFEYLFSELLNIVESYKSLSITAIILIYREMLKNQKLSFKGSKTTGLQVMGMLETRLLDFETIIMTSVNEGILPSGKSENSYITYGLKRDYGLPTHLEKDAVYAYHFFRLLQKAKKCFLIYDNDQSGFNKGDKSRFITYLEVFNTSKYNLTTSPFILNTSLKKSRKIEIEKDQNTLLKLKKLAEKGFSPTALSSYISNPINFYKRYILNVEEEESIENVINSRDYGTIIHNTLENLYPVSGNLNVSLLKSYIKIYKKELKKEIKTKFSFEDFKTGQNRIKLEIANTSIKRFLEIEQNDLSRNSIEIVGLEKEISAEILIQNVTVKLRGKIDRIDKRNDTLRIIDLKTGFVNRSDLKFDEFDDIVDDEEKAKAFQTLFYAYLYFKNYNISNIQAGVISFKNLSDWFMPVRHHKNGNINDEFLISFEEKLINLIEEILDPDIPFTEKESIFE